jgi:hypothetical protein
VIHAGRLVLAGYSYSSSSGGSDLLLTTVSTDNATAVYEPEQAPLPSGFTLAQNYPNPFNLSTHISFTIPRRSRVELSIYNILGQLVKSYAPEVLPAGTFTVEWDGNADDGRTLASGIYFYRFVATDFVATRKMALLK